MYKYKTRAAVL